MSLSSAATRSPRRGYGGFSLIEMMVGVVIGLIAVLVIYQVFAAAEGIKRNTTSVGDAQQNGLLSSFMLTIELANASNGIASAASDLGTCPVDADIAKTFRPIPLLIIDGGAGSDQFVVNYSLSSSLVAPASFKAGAVAGADFLVLSPTGFKPGDLVLAISGSGICVPSKVNSVGPPDADDAVQITHSSTSVALPSSASLLNLGPSVGAQRVRYDVTANGVLRSAALWDTNGAPADPPVPNPMASNIVIMKLQYGIDSGAGVAQDGILDAWVNPTGDWAAANVLAAPINGSGTVTTLNRILAARIGIVVQGEQYDKDLAQSTPNPTWTLFANNPASGGALTGPLPPGFRYRTYETIVPLRNTIWNFKNS